MPISPINSINNRPSFGAKLKIANEGYELLCKYDKEVLQAAASKVETKSDIIHVNIGKYEYGRTGVNLKRNPGWDTERTKDSVPISVKSLIQNTHKTMDFLSSGYGYMGVTDNIVETLTRYFTKLAGK